MYGVRGSQTIPRETNLLFSSAFKHPDGQFVKSKEFASSDLYSNQQSQPSSGLMRYRSAPSSFFASLVDGGAVGCEEFLNPHQSSSPESEAIFARFVSSNGDSEPQDLQFATKNETPEANQYNMYQNSLNHNDLSNPSNLGGSHANIDGLYKVTNGAAMRSPVQGNANSGNCSNLVRQSSSPPGLFSNLAAENGFSVMRDGGNFKVGNGANGRANQTSRLNDHINFSSGPSSSSRFMPQIIENRNESSSPENGRFGNANSSNGFYGPSFQNDSWNNSGFTGIKRNRDDEEKFSGFTLTQSQNEDSRNYTTGLTHHLSLPKTSAELAAIEKYLQFQQDAVPCKTRAKRGCATHPRSIAERMRRTRISQRMKKLQELFPNMDKQTNTADMLDLAVEYIKDLQKQVSVCYTTDHPSSHSNHLYLEQTLSSLMKFLAFGADSRGYSGEVQVFEHAETNFKSHCMTCLCTEDARKEKMERGKDSELTYLFRFTLK